jgi:hypothetical protein
MWAEYKEICDLLVKYLGKARLVADLEPDDFAALRRKLAKRWGPVRLGNAIQRTRSVFKYASDAGMIDRAVRFGPGFKRPMKKVLRLHRAAQGTKLFTTEEVRKLIEAADTALKAMILLGINCGFGTADCGSLPLAAVDLDAPSSTSRVRKQALPAAALSGLKPWPPSRRRWPAVASRTRKSMPGWYSLRPAAAAGTRKAVAVTRPTSLAACCTNSASMAARDWAFTRSATPSALWPTR